MNLPPTGSATNVSEQVLYSHLIYGSSDNTNPRGLSASKSLHYAKGPTIQRPIIERITIIPYTLHFQDSVGLFGAENCFVRFDLDLKDYSGGCLEEPGWHCAIITRGDHPEPYYNQAVISFDVEVGPVDGYNPADLSTAISLNVADSVVSVDLINNKTGNIYVDDWLDVRLYTKDRQEHSENRLYVGFRDWFYVGFHARNTRELPYDVSVKLGDVVVPLDQLPKQERRYLPAGCSGNLSCANTDIYSY